MAQTQEIMTWFALPSHLSLHQGGRSAPGAPASTPVAGSDDEAD
jgi:hypothetical protein